MKDTPQSLNSEDLMVLYEELTFLVSQLNNDAPKIKKMYASLEQTVARQEANAVKAAQVVEAATSTSVTKMQKEAKDVLDTAAQYLAKAESIAKRCEAMLSQMEAMTKNIQSVREYQLAVDKRLNQFEEKIEAVCSNSKSMATTVQQGESTIPREGQYSIQEIIQNHKSGKYSVQEIIQMKKAGLAEDEILEVLRMNNAGLSKDEIIQKIRNRVYQDNSTSSISSSVQNLHRNPRRDQVSSAKNEFPGDAMRFTFKNIKSVKYKKPYGITIEGDIVNAEHWTNLLEEVILYAFRNFGIKKEHLCAADLGIHFAKTEYSEAHIVPYFVERVPSDTNYKYRPVHEVGISVMSEGADITVEVLEALLCDYLKIKPGNVELFYHKK